MDKGEFKEQIVRKWTRLAKRDLLAAKQSLEAKPVITEATCFHCQQAAEKFLKGYLVSRQIEFTKTHSIIVLLNLCSQVDASFKKELLDADVLSDYAVDLRYPDDWYEPSMEEAKAAYKIAMKVGRFVVKRIGSDPPQTVLRLNQR